MATERPGNASKIIGVTEAEEGDLVRIERTVEYTDPTIASGEFGLKSMIQTVTEEDGQKRSQTLFTDHRVLTKDGAGMCMWFGSPDEARKYAKRRGDILDIDQDYQRQGGLWLRTGPSCTLGG